MAKKTISLMGFSLIGFILILNFVLIDTVYAEVADSSIKLRDGNATNETVICEHTRHTSAKREKEEKSIILQ